jgi:6-phosphofructokinase 1
MRIGLLTGGGDSPAMNAAIRAVVRKAHSLGYEVLGFNDGWRGPIEGKHVKLTPAMVSGVLFRGGTMLGTSRTNPFKIDGAVEKIKRNLNEHKIDALIAMGGDDTLGTAHKLAAHGVKAVGIPQTIDNDLAETDYAIGFDTALNIVTECLDRLHTTAESHRRVMVVEIMGRDAGWLALLGGLAGGADVILIPEVQFDIEWVCSRLTERMKSGKTFSVVAVSEGAKPIELQSQLAQTERTDAFGHVRLGGIGQFLVEQIEKLTGLEARVTVLGHLQRGGLPTAQDRILATRFGVKAVEMVRAGEFDQMVCLKGHGVASVPLEKAVKRARTVDMDLYEMSKLFD